MPHISRHIDDLPPLDASATAHMQRVLDSLAELIESRGGFIGFDDYMAHVLYEPGLGYYSAGAAKLGAGGDFVTAPLISSLFSQTLAQFVGKHLQAAGGNILELGAGSGVMAADILQTLADARQLPGEYQILELSADLRQRQQATLEDKVPELVERVRWLDTLDAEEGFQGIILGNEVVDALPTRRFTIQAGHIMELGVGLRQGRLIWQLAAFDEVFHARVKSCLPVAVEHYPSGYRSEINTGLNGWMQSLAAYLRRGFMVLTDYGHDRAAYYRLQRSDGTLRGYHRHHAIDDPFFRPGLTDITAWVDFTALAEAASGYGFVVSGYTTQAAFLMDHGLLDIGQERQVENERERWKMAQEIKQLMLPGEMGETVKAILLAKSHEFDSGLTQDLRYNL